MEKTIVYKVMHKPTGLFYQPVKGRWSHQRSNLSSRGKLYETKQYPKKLYRQIVNISSSIIEKFNLTEDVDYEYNKSWGSRIISSEDDWVLVTYNLNEVEQSKLI